MDRVPYRRISPPRHERESYSNSYEQEANEAASSHGETIIMQCIISAVILVVVLFAGMMDIPPAQALRGGIQQVLTGAENLDELITDVTELGREWLGFEVDTPFQLPTLETENYPHIHYDIDTMPDGHQSHDEIVPIINGYEYEPSIYTYEPADESSNHTVPEPPDTPGLWD